MKKTVFGVVMGVALMALTAMPAAAQDNELGIGYVRQKQSWNDCCAQGFAIDFARAIRSTDTRSIAIFVDFARTRFTDGGFEETDNPLVAGIRAKFLRHKRVALFVQAGAGFMKWSDNDGDSGTDFLVGGGGGVQIRLTDMVDVKAQLDIFADNDSGDWYNFNRWLFAVVFKFGAK